MMKASSSGSRFRIGHGSAARPVVGAERIAGPGDPWRSRRGHSLIQMLVIISAASLLVGLGIAAIGTMLRTQAGVQEHLRQVRLRSRLARVFPEDVHGATEVQWQPDPPQLMLIDRDRTIEYLVEGSRLVRRETQAMRPLSHEEFVLKGLVVRFETSPASAPQMVHLIVTSPPVSASVRRAPRHDYTCSARLGRTHRYLAGERP